MSKPSSFLETRQSEGKNDGGVGGSPAELPPTGDMKSRG